MIASATRLWVERAARRLWWCRRGELLFDQGRVWRADNSQGQLKRRCLGPRNIAYVLFSTASREKLGGQIPDVY